VLTHHARKPLELEGGTTFTFVTGGIVAALEQARQAGRGYSMASAMTCAGSSWCERSPRRR
jgi:hypothetical protein